MNNVKSSVVFGKKESNPFNISKLSEFRYWAIMGTFSIVGAALPVIFGINPVTLGMAIGFGIAGGYCTYRYNP